MLIEVLSQLLHRLHLHSDLVSLHFISFSNTWIMTYSTGNIYNIFNISFILIRHGA